MPSTSAKQHRFMEAVAHNPAFAKKAGVPQSVGKDFSEADKGRKFAKGGDMKDMKMTMKTGKVEKRIPVADQMGSLGMKSGGMGRARSPVMMERRSAMMNPISEPKPAGPKGYSKGGYMGNAIRENPTDGSSMAGENPKIQKRGLTEGRVVKMAKGGYVSKADGCVSSGKTRGKFV